MKTAPTGTMGISVMKKENAARNAGMPDAAATGCRLIPLKREAPHPGLGCAVQSLYALKWQQLRVEQTTSTA
jgi:hypothetical protein